eukprot:5871175-Heterocapsa_arctica.AAC.1
MLARWLRVRKVPYEVRGAAYFLSDNTRSWEGTSQYISPAAHILAGIILAGRSVPTQPKRK